jgi:hypothetical protein
VERNQAATGRLQRKISDILWSWLIEDKSLRKIKHTVVPPETKFTQQILPTIAKERPESDK